MFPSFNTMVVDRDRAARDQLALMLEKLNPEIQVSTSTHDEVDSKLLTDCRPDLVFWGVASPADIMPSFVTGSGPRRAFDLVYVLPQELKEKLWPVVDGTTCLLRPIDLLHLSEVIDRSFARCERKAIMQKLDRALNLMYLNTNVILELPKLRGAEFVRSEELMYCESDNNYTTVHLRGRSPVLVSKPIRWLEDKLPGGLFVRIHKCYLINLCYLREYFKGDGGQVELQDGTIINVARNRKQVLLDAIRAFVR